MYYYYKIYNGEEWEDKAYITVCSKTLYSEEEFKEICDIVFKEAAKAYLKKYPSESVYYSNLWGSETMFNIFKVVYRIEQISSQCSYSRAYDDEFEKEN